MRLTLSSRTCHSSSDGSPFSSPHSLSPPSSSGTRGPLALAVGPLALSVASSLTTLSHARGWGSPLKPSFQSAEPRSRTTRSSVP